MDRILFTKQQRSAIETTECNVVVAAAAGSGKTAVLAERCAYLVCDAPEPQRCELPELLVVTFTEAAATEMRSRIVAAMRGRLAERSGDGRLREQMALADVAHISTLHSFCLWVIRRWFANIEIDPNATVLDAEEASLLRQEVVESWFSDLYAEGRDSPEEDPGSLGRRFLRLVDDYGLGEDRAIRKLVLHLWELTGSLASPEEWLWDARDRIAKRPVEIVNRLADELRREMAEQLEECQRVVTGIREGEPAGHFYGAKLEEYVEALLRWIGVFEWQGTERTDEKVLSSLDAIQQELVGFVLTSKGAPRLGKDEPPETLRARDQARDQFARVRDDLLKNRLQNRFGLFTSREWLDGLEK
ncbi:MAG: UvrD-helicase domain-containing protein, partial [Planctomycetota bacterium]